MSGYDAASRASDRRARRRLDRRRRDRPAAGPGRRRCSGRSATLPGRRVARRARWRRPRPGRWRRAEMLRRARRFVGSAASTTGTPELVVGSRVDPGPLRPPFDGGGYYVTTRPPHLRPGAAAMRTHFDGRATDGERRLSREDLTTRRLDWPQLLRAVPGHRHRSRRPRPAGPGAGAATPGSAGGDDVRAWATLLHAVRRRRPGLVVLPEVGTQVVVGFEAGDLHRPYIVGSCWNGREMMPVDPDAAEQQAAVRTPRPRACSSSTTPTGAAKVTLSRCRAATRSCSTTGRSRLEVTHSNGSHDHVQRRRPGPRSRPTPPSR